MSKRFTDTALYDQAWFRKLPPRLKCAWDWLCKRCDVVGVLNIDIDKMGFEIGEAVTLDELKEHFKVIVFEEDKLFIPGFVAFQYCDELGRLSPKNKFHRSIAKRLSGYGFPIPEFRPLEGQAARTQTPEPVETQIDMSPMSVDTLSDVQAMGQGQGLGKGKGLGQGIRQGSGTGEGGLGEGPPPTMTSDDRVALEADWLGTLKHFGIERPILPHEQSKIFQLTKLYGVKSTRYALAGMRFEASTDSFDPKANVSLHRAFDPKLFEKFVNLAAARVTKQKKQDEASNHERR